MSRLSTRPGSGVLLLLLALSPANALAQSAPSEAAIAELLRSWVHAWDSTNSLALTPLESDKSDPFRALRQEDVLDWPAETRALIAPSPLLTSDSRETAQLQFFQTNESRTALGVLSRASFQVNWELHEGDQGWRVVQSSLVPVEAANIPPAIRGGAGDIALKSARRALREKRPRDALELLDAMLVLAPEEMETRSPFGSRQVRSQALWLRGRVDVALGRRADAISRWMEALSLSPRFPAVDNALGDQFAFQGDLVRAVKHWRSSLETLPEQPGIAARLEVHERALEHYADPVTRALFLSAVTGAPEHGVERLTRLLSKDPAHPETRRRLALSYLLRRDPDTAHALLEEHEYFHPSDLETRYLLARTAIARDRIDDGIHWFEEVWRTRPGYRDVITFLSELNASNGRYMEAVRYLEEALQADPDDSMLLFKLGVYTEELGDRGAARAWFERAAERGVSAEIREELRRRLARLKN